MVLWNLKFECLVWFRHQKWAKRTQSHVKNIFNADLLFLLNKVLSNKSVTSVFLWTPVLTQWQSKQSQNAIPSWTKMYSEAFSLLKGFLMDVEMTLAGLNILGDNQRLTLWHSGHVFVFESTDPGSSPRNFGEKIKDKINEKEASCLKITTLKKLWGKFWQETEATSKLS